MNAMPQPTLDFEAATTVADDGEALIVDIDGYEGPLDLLLALARNQKVDLLKLSISKLADQYLAFVREARRLRFSVAADYLVMAAWLAFLKSRLLLPRAERPAEEAAPAEAVAAQLAFRIAKLDAMRRASEALKSGPILRRDVFTRGDPQAISIVSHRRMDSDLRGLMAAYLQPRAREGDRAYRPKAMESYRLDDARDRLRSLLPRMTAWTPLTRLAPESCEGDGPSRASYIASTLSAGLELVREGEIEARQLAPFAEIYLRSAPHAQ
jgi:segregation and condensation protein A